MCAGGRRLGACQMMWCGRSQLDGSRALRCCRGRWVAHAAHCVCGVCARTRRSVAKSLVLFSWCVFVFVKAFCESPLVCGDGTGACTPCGGLASASKLRLFGSRVRRRLEFRCRGFEPLLGFSG